MAGRHKRKGSDPISADTVAVSSSPIHSNNRDNSFTSMSSSSSRSSSWLHSTLQRLEQLRVQLEQDEPINEEKALTQGGHSMAEVDIRVAEKELVQMADACKYQLQQRLAKEQTTLQQESEELYQQRLLVQQLQSERDDLADDIMQLEDNARLIRQQIHQYQQDIQQTQEDIDQMEEEESRRLLRLQYEVSLYAAATGLKWYGSHGDNDKNDFGGSNNGGKTRLLQGDVAVPSQQRLRRFSFDLEKEPPFNVANKLWSMMSGDDDCFSSLLVPSH